MNYPEMTAPSTEEKRKGERRVRPHKGWIGRQPENIRQDGPDRRATERERQQIGTYDVEMITNGTAPSAYERAQKHYGAMLEDARGAIDARRYRWLRNKDIDTDFPRHGLFVGMIRKPDGYDSVLTGEDADAAIDAEILKEAKP